MSAATDVRTISDWLLRDMRQQAAVRARFARCSGSYTWRRRASVLAGLWGQP